jgi:DNA-binding transcriptional LysR family regulator
MMDIRHLKAFIAVAEELNFHRAAEKLGTVQPALSRMIRNLEDDIKVRLLERTTRHVQLTEPGKLFLSEAKSLVGQLSAAVRMTQQSAEGTVGSLTLAYMDFAVHKLLPDMLVAAATAGSDIRIELSYLSTGKQRLALMEGRIDLGIMIGQMNSPYVESMKLSDEPIIAVLPAGHRLTAKRKVTLADVMNEPILLGNEADWTAFRDIMFQLFAQEGATPRLRYEASSAAALLGLVARGLGVTFYAGQPSLYASRELAFRPLVSETKVPIFLVWRKGPKLPLIKQVLRTSGLKQ